MSSLRVFVNARGYDAPVGASALDAIRIAAPADADAVVAGTRLITDSRGLPVPAGTPAYAGVIYRVVTNRTRDGEDTA